MRLMIDAMCAEFGGIRTYVDQLLGRWHRLFPADEVHVALRGGSTILTPGLHRHEFTVRRPDVVMRPLAQAGPMHSLARRVQPDVILATAPTTDPRAPVAPLTAVILDLRAELRPAQFSRGRRLLRAVSYGRTYASASGFIAISQRSLDDLHRLHPATRSKPGSVVYLGADHVDTWPEPSRDGPAVAFAHHSNKNPHLVVEAWPRLRERGAQAPDLVLLGVSDLLRGDLAAQIGDRGLRHHVRLSPFLPADRFVETFARASMVVFPSDFEGFGLPIVEGMALDKPVVIAPDPGSVEIAGGHAEVMSDYSADALASSVIAALQRSTAQTLAAQQWARSFNWDRAVTQTRDALRHTAGQGTIDTAPSDR